jgi:TRAP-type C4-dicarboxylate transport system permease small subunit
MIDYIIDNTYDLIVRISKISTLIGGIFIIFMTGFIGVEVIIRKFFSLSFTGAEELSGYTLAIISAWSFSYTLIKKEHIRIDLLYQKLSRPLRNFLDLLAILMMIIFIYLITYFSYQTLSRSIIRLSKSNTALQIPLWIPQILWFFGNAFFLLTATVILLKYIRCLLKTDFHAATTLLGCTKFDKELK